MKSRSLTLALVLLGVLFTAITASATPVTYQLKNLFPSPSNALAGLVFPYFATSGGTQTYYMDFNCPSCNVSLTWDRGGTNAITISGTVRGFQAPGASIHPSSFFPTGESTFTISAQYTADLVQVISPSSNHPSILNRVVVATANPTNFFEITNASNQTVRFMPMVDGTFGGSFGIIEYLTRALNPGGPIYILEGHGWGTGTFGGQSIHGDWHFGGTEIPEPMSLLFLGSGIVALAARRRRMG